MDYTLYDLTCSEYRSIYFFSKISFRNAYNKCSLCINYINGECIGNKNIKYINNN